MISVQIDDIIYSLQGFGGASVYWKEVTSRIERDSRFHVRRAQPARALRGIPAYSKADIYHSSHFRVSVFGSAKNVSTVHDLNYELGYVQPGLKAKINILERRVAYFKADALICISSSTRNELLDVYPQLATRCPIYVVHHGFDNFDLETSSQSYADQPWPFVLYVGGRNGYKRFTDALQGFYLSGVWRDGVRLICTGGAFSDAELAMISELGLTDIVVSAGIADRLALAQLYRSAHCLIYSSIHEGFGLPLLEAMSCGCPVVACNTSCMPEIVGDAAVMVTPNSPDEISNAIAKLQDVEYKMEIIKRGKERVREFSWDKSADGHMDVYLKAAQ